MGVVGWLDGVDCWSQAMIVWWFTDWLIDGRAVEGLFL